MPKDYYSDHDEEAEPPKDLQPPDDERHEDEGEPTALIPKSLLAGKEFKPGEEIVMEIVHIYGDEVEIKYATGKEEKKKSSMEEAEDKMDGYAKDESGSDNPGSTMMGGY